MKLFLTYNPHILTTVGKHSSLAASSRCLRRRGCLPRAEEIRPQCGQTPREGVRGGRRRSNRQVPLPGTEFVGRDLLRNRAPIGGEGDGAGLRHEQVRPQRPQGLQFALAQVLLHLARWGRRQHHRAGRLPGNSRSQEGPRERGQGRGRRPSEEARRPRPPVVHHLSEAHQHQAAHREGKQGPLWRPHDRPTGS